MHFQDNLHHSGFSKKIFLFFFFIVLLEGAIRKWLLPNSTFVIVGIRDFIVFFCIYYGFKNKIFNFNNKFEKITLFWTLLVTIWILIQFTFFTNLPIQIALIGLRNWVLYLWLSLFFYKTLDMQDLRFIIKIILLTILPLSILSVSQHFLPVDHILNKQASEGYIFQVIEGVVRTTGTFSFTSGYNYYLMFICPLIYILVLGEEIKDIKFITTIVIVLAFLLAVTTSGSRLIIAFSVVMLIPLTLSLITKRQKKAQILLIILFSILCTYIVSNYFSRAVDATTQRFISGGQNVTLLERVLESSLGTKESWLNLSVIGRGIGKGSNPARGYLSVDEDFIFGETETQKILIEGGILGIIFVLARLVFLFFLIKAYQIKKITKSSLPFIYWFYIVLNFSLVSYVSQITAHAFTYLALSIGLILLRKNYLSKPPIGTKNYI